jgi:hypothetical protein
MPIVLREDKIKHFYQFEDFVSESESQARTPTLGYMLLVKLKPFFFLFKVKASLMEKGDTCTHTEGNE